MPRVSRCALFGPFLSVLIPRVYTESRFSIVKGMRKRAGAGVRDIYTGCTCTRNRSRECQTHFVVVVVVKLGRVRAGKGEGRVKRAHTARLPPSRHILSESAGGDRLWEAHCRCAHAFICTPIWGCPRGRESLCVCGAARSQNIGRCLLYTARPRSACSAMESIIPPGRAALSRALSPSQSRPGRRRENGYPCEPTSGLWTLHAVDNVESPFVANLLNLPLDSHPCFRSTLSPLTGRLRPRLKKVI